MTPPAFDRRAGEYNRHARLQEEAAAWLAEWLPTRIEGRALELGAGTGIFTRRAVERSGHVVATDASARMVQEGAREIPQADWRVADASRPPNGASYGWIFSSSLIQWLDDPAETFRVWHTLAAPQARLLAGWFVAGTMRNVLALAPEVAPFRWRTTDEWIRLLDGSRWRTVRHETREFVLHHPDSTALLRDIHRIGAVRPGRCGAARLRWILRSLDASVNGGKISTPFVFLRLEAVRS